MTGGEWLANEGEVLGHYARPAPTNMISRSPRKSWWLVPAALVSLLAGWIGLRRRRAGRAEPVGDMQGSPSAEPPAAEVEYPLQVTLRAAPGTRLQVTVERLREGGRRRTADILYQAEHVVPTIEPPERKPGRLRRMAAWVQRLAGSAEARPAAGPRSWLTLDRALFLLALLVYAATRLIRLEDWPIYFFTDEANQTLLALAFVRDGLRDQFGTLLPTYFRNVYQFNLSVSVYAQVIPYLLFGRSIFVTRAVAALLTLPGATAIALILRDVFRARCWWVGVFALSLTPAWFLHSRTAFETTMMVSFFACSLYFYLRYRAGKSRSLYAAVVLAGLAFYSHASGQVVVVSTALVLLLSDLRFHWRQRRQLAIAGLLVVFVALPYIRFQVTNPGQTVDHLYRLDSYWLQDIPLRDKLLTLVKNYGIAISPAYWYLPNERDLPRHLMLGYGHISLWSAPFALLGLVYLLGRWREGTSRSVLLATLTSPLGGIVAGVGITRVLAFTAPEAVITALGFAQFGTWLTRWVRYGVLALASFLVLALLNFAMLRDALVRGPTWYTDYGMGGMQYGAKQIADAVLEIQGEQPGRPIFISPTWANGTDLVMTFLLPQNLPVQTRSAAGFLQEQQELNEDMLFILTEPEYNDLLANPKAAGVTVERILPYPDGRPGFYFVHWHYSEQASALFEQERLERLRPVEAEVVIDGETVRVEHSYLDMGEIRHVFDGDVRTLARGYEANPFRLVLMFSHPWTVSGLRLTTGSMDYQLTVRLFETETSQPVVYREAYRGLPGDPTVEMRFSEGPAQVIRIELEALNLNEGERSKIHLRELVLD
ncbi:MAG: glycosyltransferase family 39 protein [Chloroflexota bacterium]